MSADLLQPRNMHKKEHAPQTSRGGEKASAFRSKGFRLAKKNCHVWKTSRSPTPQCKVLDLFGIGRSPGHLFRDTNKRGDGVFGGP